MKRNGIESKSSTNGQRLHGVLNGHKNGRAANHESHIAQKIEQSISYMLQHVNQPLQVATLAAAANVSPSHYSALFKRWMGCPPMDYFTHLRMRHACQLFDNTSLNVKEVAAALGYDDPFYFSRMFKAANQIAPSEYRMRSKESKARANGAALPSVLASDNSASGGRCNAQQPVNGQAESRWRTSSAALPGFASLKERHPR